MDFDDLLPLIALGDVNAFKAFLAGTEVLVRNALRSFASRIDTEAIVQETYLRMWQVAPRVVVDARGNSYLRLTFRTARNLAISEVRRRRETLMPTDEMLDEVLDDGPAAIDVLLRARILECLEALPHQPKAALTARLESEGQKPDRELAVSCNMQANTFLQNVTRARKLVAECLERRGIEVGGGR